jgi:hypothetical protein
MSGRIDEGVVMLFLKLNARGKTTKFTHFQMKGLATLCLGLILFVSACAPAVGTLDAVTETPPPAAATLPPTTAATLPPTASPTQTPIAVPVTLEPVPSEAIPPEGGSTDRDQPAAQGAIRVLSEDLQADPAGITVVSITPMEFTDGCLGLGGADEMCLQAITPGYVVVLEAGGQEYVFHTNENGSHVRQAQAIGIRPGRRFPGGAGS